jgi:hypothetical protein
MNSLISSLTGLPPVGLEPLTAKFDGGRLLSDGGLILRREIE